MRELKLVSDESTGTSLVLVDDHGERYFLPVDPADPAHDALSALLAGSARENERENRPVTVIDESAPQSAGAPPQTDPDDTEAKDPPEPAQQPEPAPQPKSGSTAARGQNPSQGRSLPRPDPLFSAPLTMRPREIQARIRAGASVAELAGQMGVAESRVEVYAHPVLLERTQIAQLARSSHPVRDDGPAKLTLAEVLAAAFGARGHSFAEATWDAFREPEGQWIVRVSWQAGLSQNEAEWIFHRHSSTSATTEPRNAIAADLTDPDFVQPVRSLTSISRGTRYDEPMPADRGDAGDDLADPDPPAVGTEDARDAGRNRDAEVAGEDILDDTDSVADQRPAKRRRKAVTPHWEDVLLGVRTNTKRPKN